MRFIKLLLILCVLFVVGGGIVSAHDTSSPSAVTGRSHGRQ